MADLGEVIYLNSSTDPIGDFEQFVRERGLEPGGGVRADGRIHRCPTKGKRTEKDGAYCIYLGPDTWGWCQDWRVDDKPAIWRAWGVNSIDQATHDAMQARIVADRLAYEAARQDNAARAARDANRRWESAQPVFEIHGTYLDRKGIGTHSVRKEGDSTILVPMLNDTGQIVNIQAIKPDGTKLFMKGGQTVGCHFVVGAVTAPARIHVAEGFATAASIFGATGQPCVVAFSGKNLKETALWAQKAFPAAELIICGDDDWKRVNNQSRKPENIGLLRAREAAAASGARLAKPDFGEHRNDNETDFNDLAQRLGLDAVRASIEASGHVRWTPEAETAPGERASKTSEVVFEPICAGTLLRHPAPPRRWLVPGWIPKNVVTLLGGDGGVGKSTLAMQLGVAAATGAFWLGADVNKARTFVLSAEDDQDEMHFRLEKILEGLPGGHGPNRIALEGNLWLLDATDELDPTLATYDAAKRVAPTDTYSRIAEFIGENNIGLFIADSAADVFSEEIDRHAVRSFIRQLKAIGCTVLLLGHPSVDGMKTGRGYSGSTHWNNAVRSRLYFTRAEADPDLRILDMPKANRARAGQRKVVRWTENGFVHDSAAENALNDIGQQLKAEEAFLRLLNRFCEEGRPPSPKPSSTYAPTAFAAHPGSEGISKTAFKKAMDVLLGVGKIEIVTVGPPSRRYQYLSVKEDGVGDDDLDEDGFVAD
jgi:phage/plasmid primase-like uncharacterized protein/RecA-family ATPase